MLEWEEADKAARRGPDLGVWKSDMTEQDSNHRPGEDFAPLYPDQVYDWETPRMPGFTAYRFRARTNDLIFQEYPRTNSVVLRDFPASERVLRED